MREIDSGTVRMRRVRACDERLLLEWRNHPQVREHMFTRSEIAAAEHGEWLRRNLTDPRRLMLIYERSGIPLGFVGLHLGQHPNVADWGFYTAPDAPKGTGRAMAGCALEHGFRELALHKVCGQVLDTNQRSIRLHAALGFRQEGVLREQHFDGERYRSVVCFGLLEAEWVASSGE